MSSGTRVWRIFLAALLMAVVGQVIHMLSAGLGMGYYSDPEYVGVWSPLMMPIPEEGPPAYFFYYSLLFGFISAGLFAVVYSVLQRAVPGRGRAAKGLAYGLLVFLVAGIPGMLSLYLLINLPVGLIGLWAVETLVVYLLGGMIVAGLVTPKMQEVKSPNE